MVDYSLEAYERYRLRKKAYIDRLSINLKTQCDKYEEIVKNKTEKSQKKIEGEQRRIARMKYALQRETEIFSFLRPRTEKDMDYRLRQFKEFPKKVQETIPDNLYLLFHGTSICNAREIIKSGSLTSSVDRLGFETSYDVENQVSVTTKATLNITIDNYSDLTAEDGFLPAGCIFVLCAKDEKDGSQLLTDNVHFKDEPDKLYAIVTTPENIRNVKEWMNSNGMESSKIHDFNSFINLLKQEKNYSQSLGVSKAADNCSHYK